MDGQILEFVNYFLPLLVGIGIIGNVLSLMAFYFSKIRCQLYFNVAIALSDFIFLTNIAISWMIDCKYSHMVSFIAALSSFTSTWFAVVYIIDRFIVMCYPIERSLTRTKKRSSVAILSVIILGGLFNLPFLVYPASQIPEYFENFNCGIIKENKVII